jgi:hypothetical protein
MRPMRAMTPQEALRNLDRLGRAGKIDPLKFLERNYILQGSNQKRIRFEP